MSIDFSIKPSNAPVAVPLVSSVSVATDDAVTAQLPKPLTVAAVDATAYARNDTRPEPDGVSRQIVIDQASASFVYQTVDERTNEVISQFPDDAILRRRAYFETLDRQKDATPPTPTDRRV